MALATLLTAALAACGGDSGGPGDEGTARARAMHLSPNSPAVDVTLDGDELADGIVYGQSTPYAVVPAGPVELAVALSATDVQLDQVTPTLARDADYTVLATGLADEVQAVVLTDDNAPPTAGFFKLRVVNAAPSAPAIDVHVIPVGEDLTVPIHQNVAFGAASPYLERSQGDGEIVITVGGTLSVLAGTGAIEFTPGEVLTFILADAGGGGAPFIFFFLDRVT